MAIFRAEFTGTAATLLSAYSPEEGTTGTEIQGFGTSTFQLDGSGRLSHEVTSNPALRFAQINGVGDDFTLVVQMYSDDAGSEAVMCYRSSVPSGGDPTNAYELILSAGQLLLRRRSGGFTDLATVTSGVPGSTMHEFTLTVSGSQHTVVQTGVGTVINVTDATHASGNFYIKSYRFPNTANGVLFGRIDFPEPTPPDPTLLPFRNPYVRKPARETWYGATPEATVFARSFWGEPAAGPTLLDATHNGRVALGGIFGATLTQNTSHNASVRLGGIAAQSAAQATGHTGAVRAVDSLTPTIAPSAPHSSAVRLADSVSVGRGQQAQHNAAVRLLESLLPGISLAVRHDGFVRLADFNGASVTPSLDASHNSQVRSGGAFVAVALAQATAHNGTVRPSDVTDLRATQNTAHTGAVRLADVLASVSRVLSIAHAATVRLTELVTSRYGFAITTNQSVVRLTGESLASIVPSLDGTHFGTVRSGGAFLSVGISRATAHQGTTALRESITTRLGISVSAVGTVRLTGDDAIIWTTPAAHGGRVVLSESMSIIFIDPDPTAGPYIASVRAAARYVADIRAASALRATTRAAAITQADTRTRDPS